MKRLLNTLYVMTQGAWLLREGETILVSVEKEVRLRVPIHTLGAIVCFGRINPTYGLIHLCGERGVGLTFLRSNGRLAAHVSGPITGNVLLRRAQHRAADEPAAALDIARSIVAAKIANSRHVLLRARRDGPEQPALAAAIDSLARTGRHALTAESLDILRGREGEAASTYFSVFDHLLRADTTAFEFDVRSRRPPLNRTNAMLSFLYAILRYDIQGALDTVGLDPQIGFLHADRPGRPSLALDLMEEFRAPLADRLVLSLINRQQIKPTGFDIQATGGVRLADDTRRTILTAWQKRKQEEIIHPFLNERIPLGLAPHIQATLLARHLRGDLDAYPPFIWK